MRGTSSQGKSEINGKGGEIVRSNGRNEVCATIDVDYSIAVEVLFDFYPYCESN